MHQTYLLQERILQTEKYGSPHVGITSRMITEISGGPLPASETELIELNLDHPEVIKNGEVNYRFLDRLLALGNNYTIHGPYVVYPEESRNLALMRCVFRIARYIDARYIVIHTGVVRTDYRDALLKTVASLRQYSKIAAEYQITLLVENMVRERLYDRVGVLPREVLQVIEWVDEENLKFCFDAGHGFLSARQYGFDILEFVRVLSPYIVHMHIHDNIGVPPVIDDTLGDQHLPIGKGSIDYALIIGALDKSKVKNLILELMPSTTSRDDAQRSLATLNKLAKI